MSYRPPTIITPNQFELTVLTGLPAATMDEVLAAADAARASVRRPSW